MLKDLFFNIWYDEMGNGWLLLIFVLFLFCLAFLVYKFARIKATNNKFQKKHLIYLGFIIIVSYQIIPVSIDLIANIISYFDIKKSIQIESIAIKTSMIPWQKGGYYCKLSTLHLLNKDNNKMYKTYDIAYKYIKSYKYPCWGTSYLSFYTKGDYDKAIEIAKNWKGGKTPYQFISNCYLMKNDIKKAELYNNKAIQQKPTYSNYAIKAYILKSTKNPLESITYYKKALSLCKDEKEKNIVQNTYKNFVKFENDRLITLKKQQGLN